LGVVRVAVAEGLEPSMAGFKARCPGR